jgi:hypothetical protein
MTDRIEVAWDIIKLAETIKEGIQHIHTQADEESIMDADYLFEDIVTAFTSVFKSLQLVYPYLSENRLMAVSEQLVPSMQKLTKCFQHRDEEKAGPAFQDLLPVFEAWYDEITRVLQLYTAS